MDPWVGSATGPVQARMLGINGIGIDIDPIACLIARVSLTPYDADQLDDIFGSIAEKLELIETELSLLRFEQDLWSSGTVFSLNGFRSTIPENRAIDFWFAPVQRVLLALLVDIAKSVGDPRYQAVLQLAISSSIIRKWPNTISLAMDIDHSRPHRVLRDDITVSSQIGVFRKVIRDTFLRLKTINACCRNHIATWQVIEGDTKNSLNQIEHDSIDYILTSPPYFNAIDYPRAHKFSQWWLWPEREPLGKTNYLGLMPGTKKHDETIESIALDCRGEIDDLLAISPALHRSFCKYIVELNDVVVQFQRLLKKGGRATLVIGDNNIQGHNIPTSKILARMLERSGLVNIRIEPRSIQANRRRYPYGIVGFKELMKSEYIVHASNP